MRSYLLLCDADRAKPKVPKHARVLRFGVYLIADERDLKALHRALRAGKEFAVGDALLELADPFASIGLGEKGEGYWGVAMTSAWGDSNRTLLDEIVETRRRDA